MSAMTNINNSTIAGLNRQKFGDFAKKMEYLDFYNCLTLNTPDVLR